MNFRTAEPSSTFQLPDATREAEKGNRIGRWLAVAGFALPEVVVVAFLRKTSSNLTLWNLGFAVGVAAFGPGWLFLSWWINRRSFKLRDVPVSIEIGELGLRVRLDGGAETLTSWDSSSTRFSLTIMHHSDRPSDVWLHAPGCRGLFRIPVEAAARIRELAENHHLKRKEEWVKAGWLTLEGLTIVYSGSSEGAPT